MAKETKQEKLARQKIEQEQAELNHELHLKSLPKRIADAAKLSESLNINREIKLTATGPEVRFYTERDNPDIFDIYVNYSSDVWEIEYLEDILRKLQEERTAKAARKTLAEETWVKLSVEEKLAIKENIYNLY